MSLLRAALLLGLGIFSAVLGCGESGADDDAVTPGSSCAKNADCPSELPTCSQAGKCIAGECETDADCRPQAPYCIAQRTCQPCREDADCPTEAPVCALSWESGVYCAECRVGDSSTCSAGTWCSSPFISAGQGGTCEHADCSQAPDSAGCLACANANSALCVTGDGPCVVAKDNLETCYETQIPGWTEGDCPLDLPSFRGCTPQACQDEATAYDACIVECSSVVQHCSMHP